LKADGIAADTGRVINGDDAANLDFINRTGGLSGAVKALQEMKAAGGRKRSR